MLPSSEENKEGPRALPDLTSKGSSFAIATSRFNAAIVDRLLEGALEALRRTGTERDDVTLVSVPGAFELPVAALRLTRNHDAVIALGCVVRGETPHFKYVSEAAAQGLQRVSLDSGVPVGFGVLTTDTVEQALARSGGDHGNRGYDAALAAIEMVSLLRER